MKQDDELERLSRSLGPKVDIDLSGLPADVEDPGIPVLLSDDGNRRGIWRISLALTDCYGEINLDQREKKPFRSLLEVNGMFTTGLYGLLIEQMWGDSTSIVRKDGVFGILYEAEFDADQPGGPTSSEVTERLLSGFSRLRERFPRVDFAVPSREYWPTETPAVWAFAPSGAITGAAREELGFAIDRLYEEWDARG